MSQYKNNKTSTLLTLAENKILFQLLGRKCESLYTAVVEIDKPEGMPHSAWNRGVVCFVKDSEKRSFFMRAYCLIKNKLIWELELNDDMQIVQTNPFQLTLEIGDGCVVLNCITKQECETCYRFVSSFIEKKNQKRRLQLRYNKTDSGTPSPNENILSNTFKLSGSDDPRNKTNTAHVGWDVNKGFHTKSFESDGMSNLFSKFGISDLDQINRDTEAFIEKSIKLASEIKAPLEPMPQVPSSQIPQTPPMPAPRKTMTASSRPSSSNSTPIAVAPPAPAPAPRKTMQDSNLKLSGFTEQKCTWDVNKGFELTGSENHEIVMIVNENFLKKAGVTESNINDRQTRSFIYDFLMNYTSENQEEIKTPSEPSPQIQQESKATRAASSRPSSSNATPATPLTPIAVSRTTSPSSAATTPKNNMRNRSLGWDKKRKLTKSDISSATNPLHVMLIGWENHKGLVLRNSESDDMLTNFLAKASVSKPQLNPSESRSQKPQIRLRHQVPHIPAAAPFPVPEPRNMLNRSFGLSVSDNNGKKDSLSEAPSRHAHKRVDLGDEALPDIFTRRLQIPTE